MIRIKSLKSKILIYLILFATIPMLISSIMILNEMYKTKKESIFIRHYQILKQVEEESDNIVSHIEYLAVYVKDKYLIKKTNLLKGLIRVQKNISAILILNKHGKLINFSTKNKSMVYKGYDYSNRKYFKEISSGKETYWSEVYLSPISSLPSISYSIRIDEEHIAVLVINLGLLNDFVKKFKSASKDTLVRITDKHGVYLAYPDKPEFISQQKLILNSDIYTKYISKNYTNKQIIYNSNRFEKYIGVYGTSKKLKWNIIVYESYDYLFKTFNTLVWFLVMFIIILILISIYFSIRFSKSVLMPLEKVSINMDNFTHNKEVTDIKDSNYDELNKLVTNFELMRERIKHREDEIRLEIEKNKEKDIQLFEQSKMAAMGEMIGNIAHQWRQPLSVISTSATAMLMQKEYGILSDEKFENSCESINNQAQYLSKTIDDFKNFIKGDRNLEEVSIKTCIDSFISLITPSATGNNIKMILNIDKNILWKVYPNELIQCFINIFNNSKDAYAKDCDNKLFFIEVHENGNTLDLTFKDNAGGIPKDVINKIFEPYFTTKHKSKGTGLGLHMTYNIITEGMKGNISVINEEYIYEDKKYKGASFIISIPKNI